MKKITLKISGMHCSSCAMSIDGDLEDLVEGVHNAKTNYAKQECEVEFNEEKVSVGQLISQVKQTGYQAEIKK